MFGSVLEEHRSDVLKDLAAAVAVTRENPMWAGYRRDWGLKFESQPFLARVILVFEFLLVKCFKNVVLNKIVLQCSYQIPL